MNKFGVISKAIGLTAAGMLLYDAASEGAHVSKRDQVRITANTLPDAYVNSNRMDKYSRVGNKLKKEFFNWRLSNGIPEFFAGIGGFFKGTLESLANNVLPVGLTVGALMFKKAGRVCAAGLALCGIKYFVNDVMGVGKPKLLKDDF